MRAVINSISKSYPDEKGSTVDALEKVDFVIEDGEFVAVVGRSGCGKTTLLNIVAGLLPSSSGEVVFEDLEAKGRPLTAVVFQELGLFPWRTVVGNITDGLEEQSVPRKDRLERARGLIRLVGLEGFESYFPHQLSGGMKQRTAIARALAVNPELLLLDEPFSALDAQIRMDMQLELSRIYDTTGQGVLYITHYIPEAVFLADRVVIMGGRPGRVQEIVSIDLPRPRVERIKVDPCFVNYLDHIWNFVRDGENCYGAQA